MPIVANFPKRQTYASSETRGLMKKEDVLFLHSLQDKLNSVGDIIGRKVHSFTSFNEVQECTNLTDGEAIVVLGNESMLDDGYIRVYKISTDQTWKNDRLVIPLNYGNLYAKLVITMIDDDSINKVLADILASLSQNVEISESEIENIIASAGNEDCEEILDSRVDENGVSFSSMKQRINNIGILCNNRNIRKYGVKFIGNRYFGDRLYNAHGLKASPSTDNIKNTNDFDSIYPWSDIIRCNGYYEENGNFVVTAYEGEPTFALDGSNGNVWVEIPRFFIREVVDEDYIIMELCSTQLAEYRLPEKFINSDMTTKEKVYIAAYGLSEYNNTPASISGVDPEYGSYKSLLENIKLLGGDYCGYSVDDYEIIRFLFCIEYATRNCQSVMYGATNLAYRVDISPVENSNILTVHSTFVKFAKGQNCHIEDIDGNIIIDNISIVSSYIENDYTVLTLDKEVNIPAGCSLYTKPWKTGSTNSVLGASGSPVSNISGLYPCRYRYIENPWGNQWSILYQVLCKSSKLYYCKSAINVSDDITNYSELNYTLPESNGYITKLGTDKKFPSCKMPNSLEGGNSYTAYSDIFINNDFIDGEINPVLIGGDINSGVAGGLHAFKTDKLIGSSNMFFGTRLSYSK